jgi:hypothetical protein
MAARIVEIHTGDVVRLKKAHPCGGFAWQVDKVGFNVEARCLECGKHVDLVRSEFERRVTGVMPGK